MPEVLWHNISSDMAVRHGLAWVVMQANPRQDRLGFGHIY